MGISLDRIESHLPRIVEPVHNMVRGIREGLSKNPDLQTITLGDSQHAAGWWREKNKGDLTIHHEVLILTTDPPQTGDLFYANLLRFAPLFHEALLKCKASLSASHVRFPRLDPRIEFLMTRFEFDLGTLPEESINESGIFRLIGELLIPIFRSGADADPFHQDPNLLYGPGMVSTHYTFGV